MWSCLKPAVHNAFFLATVLAIRLAVTLEIVWLAGYVAGSSVFRDRTDFSCLILL